MFFDDYDTPVFRPPSEANSFILRVTRGCAHNKCTYCNMYRGVPFQVLTDEEIATRWRWPIPITGTACAGSFWLMAMHWF